MTDAQKPMIFEECVKAAAKYLFNGRSVWTMKDMDEVTDYIRRLFRPLFVKQQATLAERDKTIGELRGLLDRDSWEGKKPSHYVSLKEQQAEDYKCSCNSCYEQACQAALAEQPGEEE